MEPERRRVCLAAADGLETAAADLPGHARALSAAVASLMALDERPDTAGYARTIWLRPGLREHPVFERFADVCSLVAEALSALAAAAGLASEALPEDHRESPQTRALAQEAGEAATLLAGLPEISLPGTVAWAGLESPDRWSLTRAPLSPGPAIREALWDRLRSAVLTSATLSVNDSFAYFRGQAGLARDLEVQEKVFPSPFDFRSHALLVVEHDPETVYSAPERPARQAAHLRRLIEATGGQLLALFTNRREMEAVAAAVGEHVEDEGVMLLAQGVHGSAAALADEFRAHPATVLLGVDALWTGQDFPGDTLVCLVIAKLPFPRQDALFQARRQTCEDEAATGFGAFYLPQAVCASARVRTPDPHRDRPRRGRRPRPPPDAEDLRARLPGQPPGSSGGARRPGRAPRGGGRPPAPPFRDRTDGGQLTTGRADRGASAGRRTICLPDPGGSSQGPGALCPTGPKARARGSLARAAYPPPTACGSRL